METLCHFVFHQDGICRCARVGCSNQVRSQDPERCRARCRAPSRNLLDQPCRHLGQASDKTLQCKGCPGSPRIHTLFHCSLHKYCLPLGRVRGAVCCETCTDYEPEKQAISNEKEAAK